MKLEESNNLSIESEQLLIVEGQDEKGFFAALLKYLDINTVQIINVAGRENLKNTLESLSIITNFDKVTILDLYLMQRRMKQNLLFKVLNLT